MGSHDAALQGSADAGDLDELLKLHVKEAVRSKLQQGARKHAPYNSLVEQIRRIKEAALRRRDAEQAEYLTAVVDALSACASSLHEREHEALLQEVLDIPIWTAPQELRGALLRLVTHAVVANSALVPLCLRVLAAGLQPPPLPPAAPLPQPLAATAAAVGSAWEPSEEAVEIQGQVVAALEKVLALVPTAPARLVGCVAGGWPHRLRDAAAQCLYLRGALLLAERPAAARAVREGVLVAAAEHLLGLDVEVRWEDIAAAEADAVGEEDAESEHEEEDIFELEGQTEQLHLSSPAGSHEEGTPQEPNARLVGRGGWEGAACGPTAEPASPSGQQGTPETAEKLDALMELVFAHLARRCEVGQLAEAWGTLLGAFERSILHTHRSKFTQYLLWFLADKDPEACSRSLLAVLLARVTSPTVAPITRSAAAAYLASFLARASFVPDTVLVDALQALMSWCLGYTREADERERASQAAFPQLSTRLDREAPPVQDNPHQVFYAACQGLLYVLCYRLEHLMSSLHPHAASSSGGGATAAAAAQKAAVMQQMFSDAMPQLLHHRLAPLSVCLPTVSTEFARLAGRLRLMECGALLPRQGSGTSGARAARPLEMFFPFDPFLLRRSAQYLDLGRTYVRWKAGHPQAGADAPETDAASDATSDEEVEAASQSDAEEAPAEGTSSDDDDNDSTSSLSSGDEAEGSPSERLHIASSSAGLLPQQRTGVPGELQEQQQHQRRRPPRQQIARAAAEGMHTWPHAPLGMLRPVSACGSRKRAASSTPGSDQGFLQGASFDTIGTISPEGLSPGGSPPHGHAPMSWQQNLDGNPFFRGPAALQQPVDA